MQSVKLAVYEERAMVLAQQTRHVPAQLARHGHVLLGRRRVSQLLGQLYLQTAAVNLLSPVLDTPEFIRASLDELQVGPREEMTQ